MTLVQGAHQWACNDKDELKTENTEKKPPTEGAHENHTADRRHRTSESSGGRHRVLPGLSSQVQAWLPSRQGRCVTCGPRLYVTRSRTQVTQGIERSLRMHARAAFLGALPDAAPDRLSLGHEKRPQPPFTSH